MAAERDAPPFLFHEESPASVEVGFNNRIEISE
jgi:hypothetical protein